MPKKNNYVLDFLLYESEIVLDNAREWIDPHSRMSFGRGKEYRRKQLQREIEKYKQFKNAIRILKGKNDG